MNLRSCPAVVQKLSPLSPPIYAIRMTDQSTIRKLLMDIAVKLRESISNTIIAVAFVF